MQLFHMSVLTASKRPCSKWEIIKVTSATTSAWCCLTVVICSSWNYWDPCAGQFTSFQPWHRRAFSRSKHPIHLPGRLTLVFNYTVKLACIVMYLPRVCIAKGSYVAFLCFFRSWEKLHDKVGPRLIVHQVLLPCRLCRTGFIRAMTLLQLECYGSKFENLFLWFKEVHAWIQKKIKKSVSTFHSLRVK